MLQSQKDTLEKNLSNAQNLISETQTKLATTITTLSATQTSLNDVKSLRDRQQESLKMIHDNSDALIADLQRVVQVVDKNCGGDGSGKPASSNPVVIAITSKTASTISGFKASASAAMGTP